MKRSGIGPGKKSKARGSTFKPRGRAKQPRRDARPEPLDVKAIMANNPRSRPGKREHPQRRGWKGRVFNLYGRRCLVCNGRAAQGHHVVPRRTIEAREGLLSELCYDERNGVPVCFDCHQGHEGASKRIPYALLPPGVIAWAKMHDFMWVIDRPGLYPR